MTGPTTTVFLDDGTGTFPHEITSKCLLGPGYSFSRGRDDEQSSVTAGSLSLTLNNSDGRFTPGSTVIASPSPIRVDQRIRVKETVNGVTYTRFTGYVKSWPVQWPGVVDTFSTVQITATDLQARLERRVLRSVIEEEILSDGPAAYYTLGEPADSTSAADTSGNQAPALTMVGTGTDVVFGNATGPGTDGLTAAEFAGGKWFEARLNATPTAMGCYFSTTTTPTVGTAMVLLASGASTAVGIDSTGKINSGATMASPVVTDGTIHALLWESGHIYLDGVDIGSGHTPGGAAVGVGGRQALVDTALVNVAVPFTGTIAHVATFGASVSSTRAGVYATAGSTGWDPAATVDDVVNQILGWVGERATTVGTFTTVPAFADITGKSPWGLLSELADDAEGGLAYVDGSGAIILHSRNVAPEKTSPDATIDAAFVVPDATPVVDDQQIKNYFETTAAGTGVAQVVRNAASEAAHGQYPNSKTYLVQTDAEALDRANWLVSNHAEPSVRFGSITVNLLAMTAAQQEAAVANLEPGAWLRVTNLPSQTPGGGASVDLMVESIAPKVSSTEWQITCNVVSRDLYTAWILGDSTYGVLDSTTKLYV